MWVFMAVCGLTALQWIDGVVGHGHAWFPCACDVPESREVDRLSAHSIRLAQCIVLACRACKAVLGSWRAQQTMRPAPVAAAA